MGVIIFYLFYEGEIDGAKCTDLGDEVAEALLAAARQDDALHHHYRSPVVRVLTTNLFSTAIVRVSASS